MKDCLSAEIDACGNDTLPTKNERRQIIKFKNYDNGSLDVGTKNETAVQRVTRVVKWKMDHIGFTQHQQEVQKRKRFGWCIGNYRHDRVLQQSAGDTLTLLQTMLANDEDLQMHFTASIRAQQQCSLDHRRETIHLQEQQQQQEGQKMH
eukprot:741998-Ditylum_brightwellii.AAC.1